VFITFASGDGGLAQLIVKTLRGLQVDCVWNDREVRPDNDARSQQCEDAIRSADCYVILVSPDALSSGEVHCEIGMAVARARLSGMAAVIPVLIGNTATGAVPGYLRRADPIDATAMTLGELEVSLVGRVRLAMEQLPPGLGSN
jgi:hypothetical protein